MARRKKKRDEVWWLANGQSSSSRQPSFAPPTARPVVTTTYFRFGWHRKRACFVTCRMHGLEMPGDRHEYPCDPRVALGILRQCAYNNTRARFFGRLHVTEEDAEVFVIAGHMFSISLRMPYSSRGSFSCAEATLQFYAPDGTLHSINLHNGMTRSFHRSIAGLKVMDIQEQMR